MENKKTVTYHGGGGGGDDPDPFHLLHVPEEVMIQILVRLSVVSLSRFKCVCKSWRDLIQTSFFIDLHTSNTTFNSSSTSSSKFGTFILRSDNSYERENVILMLSEYEGGSKSPHEYGDDDDDGRHKFSGGDWHWDNTNYGWYRCTDGKFTGGYWHWDNTNRGWYWVSDGRGHGGGDWHWDNTNYGWYWVSDGGDWHWDHTNYGWYWVSGGDGGDWHWDNTIGWYWLWDDTNGRWYWVGDDQDEVFNGWVGDDDHEDEVFKVDDDDDDQLLLKVDNLELPSSYKLTDSIFIAGSCNGLICLYDRKLRDASLWNPATRQFRILPKSITIGKIDDDDDDDDFVKSGWDFVALGFDVKTKDYKVLLITFYNRVVQVYSLSTDSWRLIEGGGINSLPYENNGLYMNGCCFFMAGVYHPASNTRSRFINSFDFTKEIFTTIQLPRDDDHRHSYDLFLHCLGGEKMALFTTLQKNSSSGEFEYDENCDIWVLNELNKDVSSSWTKLHSFQTENSITGLPIGISNNGKFAFLKTTYYYKDEILVYNLVTNKELKLDIPFSLCRSKIYVYEPSLVSVIGQNGCSSINKVIGGAM